MSARFQPLAAYRDDAVVAIGEAGSRTTAELRRDVLAVAERLPAATEGSEVVIVCGDRYCFTVGVLAAWETGHGVALPPNTQPEVVRHLSRRSAVTLLLHDTDADEGADLRAWIAEGRARPPEPRELRAIDENRHVATVYTSGTTGDHQACAKTAGQLLGEAAVLGQTFGIGGGDRVLATVPPHHIYGLLFGILMPLLSGASFIRDTPFHAETVAATARRWGATALVSVPVHLRSLTVLEAGSLPAFHAVFSSGAPLPPATAAALIESHDLRATEVFGSSETGGIAWRVSETCREPWQPLPGIRVDVDVSGRLLLDSPFLPPTEARPYVAGDRIELLEDGRSFHLLGRSDGIIKIGGKRVSLA
ncbi:MAG: AMP-binding protein, partial [Myxococcales bacterium]|nr:AMP-binding protein [Myxococcales bacterium]